MQIVSAKKIFWVWSPATACWVIILPLNFQVRYHLLLSQKHGLRKFWENCCSKNISKINVKGNTYVNMYKCKIIVVLPFQEFKWGFLRHCSIRKLWLVYVYDVYVVLRKYRITRISRLCFRKLRVTPGFIFWRFSSEMIILNNVVNAQF